MQDTATSLAQPMSVLQSTVNENGEQIEKLASLLINLTARLEPLAVPQLEHSEVGPGVVKENSPGSPIVEQLRMQGDSIKQLQRHINTLFNELEV